MPDPESGVLNQMLERLFAAIVRGPSINCRPTNSRQRLDLAELSALGDLDPINVIEELLSDADGCRLSGRMQKPAPAETPPHPNPSVEGDPTDPPDPNRSEAERAWSRQTSVIRKLRHIAEEARTYEEDTGVYILNIGFPLLSIPKHATDNGPRILAPVAFIPVQLEVSVGARSSVHLKCRYTGEERLIPNEALLTWIERQAGNAPEELFSDEHGNDPWREVIEITRHVCTALELDAPTWAQPPDTEAPDLTLASRVLAEFSAAPNREEQEQSRGIHVSAVLGLYPVSNQALLRDTQEMINAGQASEPLTSFLSITTDATSLDDSAEDTPVERRKRDFSSERFVQASDPCQARAVRLARDVRGLVIHGPPGTGKSQTITNIIGDHLSRGERVLFVCDKRTALDVVANRLKHIGLGPLCALIHDTNHDQRDLYMDVRGQLEELAETYPQPRANKRIAAIDKELQSLHDELLEVWRELMLDEDDDAPTGIPDLERAAGEGSFHDLVGQWLAIDSAVELSAEEFKTVTSDDLATSRLDIESALQRAIDVEYAHNPWPGATSLTLDALLTSSADQLRAGLANCTAAAESADASLCPGIAPLNPDKDHEQQARTIETLANALERVLKDVPEHIRRQWAHADSDALAQAHALVESTLPIADILAQSKPDAEIDLVLKAESLSASDLARDLATLADYQAIESKWWSFLAFGKKRYAADLLRRYALPLDVASAARLAAALKAKRASLVVTAAMKELDPAGDTSPNLAASFDHHRQVISLLTGPANEVDADTNASVVAALTGQAPSDEILQSLRAAPARAETITNLLSAVRNADLFLEAWTNDLRRSLYSHNEVATLFQSLAHRFNTLEEVLRITDTLESLPPSLAAPVNTLFSKGVDPTRGVASLERAHLAARITTRLAESKRLHRLDARRIETALARMHDLQCEKMDLVCSSIASRWTERQRDRLLVGTGSRLNSLGAEVKRRLLTRGRHAMRLRQVIHHGRNIEDGDPLFDLRPVWMASPETVAQIFPREPMFDVVVFDEASQCRLEEALPVLTRAKRVVVAGDPKQLPPTRFFESSVVASEQREIETDQDLFEAQQSDIEDLLGAALNLEIDHAYLDVHYRSRNADLIAFSNTQFYNSRLQAIPGHPSNRTRFSPLQLIPADGIYEDGQNPIEADRVVQVVRDLLKRADPPSIGIACFNVAQRDLIIDRLDDAAEQDRDFGRRLAEARKRRGEGSFEGLFVKNLENVQGDERDHIIISTTYGPNPEGRFYRRFGPLVQASGGRRLNVLVTRARREVHLVTSIPADQYRSLPPVPPGATPGGAWLLFAYLNYAERLADLYEQVHKEREHARQTPEGTIRITESTSPSTLAESLARSIASDGQSSELYWGNEGFCIDIALDHPLRPEDVTLGLQTDMTRFKGAADPIEWELFRTLILQSQGWKLYRAWSPSIFRDLQGIRQSVAERAKHIFKTDTDPDSLPTWQESPSPTEE